MSIPAPAFVSVGEAATMLGTTEGALRARIKRRELPPNILLRFGRRSLRVDVEALGAWLRSRPAQNVKGAEGGAT